MEGPSCRSATQIEADRFESPQNSPTVRSDPTWGHKEVVHHVLNEWVKWKPHPEVKGIWVQGRLVELVQADPLQVGKN